jgi:predicted RNase H-like HicB family nuclease
MKRIHANAKQNKIHDLDYYLTLPYKLVIVHEEAGGYFAEIDELPGCMTQGETMEEVVKNIDDAKRLWLKTALEDKLDVPLPECMREYSGRFVVRIPATLHKRIVAQSRKEGVSLNQMVLSMLSEQNGYNELKREIRSFINKTQRGDIKKTEVQRDRSALLGDIRKRYKSV